MINITNMTVLIVDDHPVTCKLIRKMLINIGYGKNILFADNGRRALDILQIEHVDLVLLDNSMPEMSGAETLSHIRDNIKRSSCDYGYSSGITGLCGRGRRNDDRCLYPKANKHYRFERKDSNCH